MATCNRCLKDFDELFDDYCEGCFDHWDDGEHLVALRCAEDKEFCCEAMGLDDDMEADG